MMLREFEPVTVYFDGLMWTCHARFHSPLWHAYPSRAAYATRESYPVITLRPIEEGITWARGWDLETADALRAANLLASTAT